MEGRCPPYVFHHLLLLHLLWVHAGLSPTHPHASAHAWKRHDFLFLLYVPNDVFFSRTM